MTTTTIETWYKYYPICFNDGVAGMSNDCIAVYQLILNRIAISDNTLRDNDRQIASLIRQSLRLYRRVRRELIDLGKLYVEDGFLRNPKADEVLAERRVRMAQKSEEARERVNRRWAMRAEERARQAPGSACGICETSALPRRVSLEDLMDETGNIPGHKLASLRRNENRSEIDENRVVSAAPNPLNSNKTSIQKNLHTSVRVPPPPEPPSSELLSDEEREHLEKKAEMIARLKGMLATANASRSGQDIKTEIDENRVVSMGSNPLKNNETSIQNEKNKKEKKEETSTKSTKSSLREIPTKNPNEKRSTKSDNISVYLNCKNHANSEPDSQECDDTDSDDYDHTDDVGRATARKTDSEGRSTFGSESGSPPIEFRAFKAVFDDSDQAKVGEGLSDGNRKQELEERSAAMELQESRVHNAVRLLRELMSLCGVDESRCFWTSVRIQEWLAAGLSADRIRDIVAMVLSQARRTNPDFVPQTLRYFDRPMENAIAKRSAA